MFLDFEWSLFRSSLYIEPSPIHTISIQIIKTVKIKNYQVVFVNIVVQFLDVDFSVGLCLLNVGIDSLTNLDLN